MKSDPELREIAQGIHEGKIFTDRHITNRQAFPMVFIGLAMMKTDDMDKLIATKPGMIYEYIDKQAPRGVNQYPMFFSCHFLNEDEAKKVIQYFIEIRDQEGGNKNAILNL